MPYFVYLLECSDKSIYTGITTDTKRRLREHQEGKGGHYTRAHTAERMIYTERHPSRSVALRREAEIKRWRRGRKIALAENAKKA